MRHASYRYKSIEAKHELLGPRRIIVGSSEKRKDQHFQKTCKGDFPFPFQEFTQYIESEVTSQDG
ncbi:hypothetical protein BXO88_04125 [Oribacterium sp. C9]|nr:hypothetical protein BXO88_04125 [Oribacterium sp. C9]